MLLYKNSAISRNLVGLFHLRFTKAQSETSIITILYLSLAVGWQIQRSRMPIFDIKKGVQQKPKLRGEN